MILHKMLRFAVCTAVAGWAGIAVAQATPEAKASGAKSQAGTAKAAPLQLQSLDPTARPDPFPAVNPKFFTADSPSVATVDSYLHAILGYDSNRIWRVMGIEKTQAPGVVKVIAMVSDRSANAKVQTAAFFITPDGKHLIADAGSGVQTFGADPFAENRAMLRARADGPSRGAVSMDLMLVEFADLQCPHCKDAQPIMTRLAQDFPKARIVYENFPIPEIHPFAMRAAQYGVCVAQKNSEAFFTFAQGVYDTQGSLTAEAGENTLKTAVTKAGIDPEAMTTCASSDVAKTMVSASTKLANDLGIQQTPMLAVNGRILPLTGIPYETLRNLIVFQAELDGVGSSARLISVPPATAEH